MSDSSTTNHRLRVYAYLAAFFLNFSLAITSYIQSSYIQTLMGKDWVGAIFIIAAAFSILGAYHNNRLIRRVGNQRALIILTSLNLLTLAGIIAYPQIIWLIAYLFLNFMLAVNLDLYLESISDNANTGRIRGFFLTVVNFAWLISPLLASNLANQRGFTAAYLISAILLLPFLYLAIRHLKNQRPISYERCDFWTTLGLVLKSQTELYANLRRIIALDFLLNFFYATMIIYLPLYLLGTIGFSLPEAGLIFTIMLIPFVLLDLILGRLADKLLGEKEILTAGVIIAGLATLAIPLLPASGTLWYWAVVLFLTRVGAASLEVMKEVYLFKKINATNINLTFISRLTYPSAYILAAGLATILLFWLPFSALFSLLGLITLIGVPIAWGLKDTK